MSPEEKNQAYLWDMRDAARVAARMVEGAGFDEYLSDEKLRSAVERKLEILGRSFTRFNYLDAARFFARFEELAWKRLGWRFQSPGKDLHLASIVMRRVAEDLSAESETGQSGRKRQKSKRGSKK